MPFRRNRTPRHDDMSTHAHTPTPSEPGHQEEPAIAALQPFSPEEEPRLRPSSLLSIAILAVSLVASGLLDHILPAAIGLLAVVLVTAKSMSGSRS
ncbi:hypothetical protein [Paenibacillus cymbidii]|uniref:hypothetical protein n=1 Tax=Paenibacillus cymbidii TaxID=1639034 RepID=UPI001081E569|nr:hypothetical protein [Paenibacillus cymbidii]